MLKVTSQQILYIDEEMCACFIDWQKACDNLVGQIGQIAKETGNDWHESKLSSKFHMDQNVKI
jgi:hypothetical protein